MGKHRVAAVRVARWATESAGVAMLAWAAWQYLAEPAGIAIAAVWLILLSNRR